MGEMKPTPGPWSAHHDHGWLVVESACGSLCLKVSKGSASQDHMADARLIAEAGTVFHNTGLSPVPLVEMVRELRETLLNLYYYVSCNVESGLPKGVNIRGKEFIEARAALAKCEGVGNE